jgi:hypothetical protein
MARPFHVAFEDSYLPRDRQGTLLAILDRGLIDSFCEGPSGPRASAYARGFRVSGHAPVEAPLARSASDVMDKTAPAQRIHIVRHERQV